MLHSKTIYTFFQRWKTAFQTIFNMTATEKNSIPMASCQASCNNKQFTIMTCDVEWHLANINKDLIKIMAQC